MKSIIAVFPPPSKNLVCEFFKSRAIAQCYNRGSKVDRRCFERHRSWVRFFQGGCLSGGSM